MSINAGTRWSKIDTELPKDREEQTPETRPVLSADRRPAAFGLGLSVEAFDFARVFKPHTHVAGISPCPILLGNKHQAGTSQAM